MINILYNNEIIDTIKHPKKEYSDKLDRDMYILSIARVNKICKALTGGKYHVNIQVQNTDQGENSNLTIEYNKSYYI